MEDQALDPQTNEPQSSYKVIACLGSELKGDAKALVYATFLRTLRFGNEYFKLIDSKAYYPAYHSFIESLLSRPQSIIRMAVLEDSPDVILGWSLSELEILHYIFVKKDCRRAGIARSLTPFKIGKISHITHIGATIWNNKLKDVSFNPFI